MSLVLFIWATIILIVLRGLWEALSPSKPEPPDVVSFKERVGGK